MRKNLDASPQNRNFSRRSALKLGLIAVPIAASFALPSNAAAAQFSGRMSSSIFSTTDTPGYLPPFSSRPIGTAYVRWEDLVAAGDDITTSLLGNQTIRKFGAGVFQAIISRCPAGKIITFPAGVFEINQPGWNAGDSAACQWPKSSAGAIGNAPPGKGWDTLTNGSKRTVFRVKANTSADKNVAGAWFKGGYSGSIPQTYANIHFEGTEQGMQNTAGKGLNGGPGNDGTSHRIFTNAFFYNMANGSSARDLLSTGWFGNNGAPPGESFGIQWYHSTGGVLSRCNTDGRRVKGGPIFGAVGLTLGNCLEGIVSDCQSAYNQQAGLVFFQSVNCKSYDCVLGSPTDFTTNHVNGYTKGSWLNHERTNGSEHHNITLNTHAVGRSQVEHITHSGDSWVLSRGGSWPTANGTLTLINPTYSNILFGGKLAYGTWGPGYGSGVESIVLSNPPRTIATNGAPIPAKWNLAGTWRDV